MNEPLNDAKCEFCGAPVGKDHHVRLFFGFDDEAPRGEEITKRVLCDDCMEQMRRQVAFLL